MEKALNHSNGYTKLLQQVKRTLIEGQQRIEQEKVRTYWETGKIIHSDILKHKDRGAYGAQVIKQLADDLNVNLRLLQRCIQFARSYPTLPKVSARTFFTWSHYRELISIPDGKKRAQLEKYALANEWSTDELALRIKDQRPKTTERHLSNRSEGVPDQREGASRPLVPIRGSLYTYQITKRPTIASDAEPELLIDLGFSNFHKVEDELISKFTAGQIIKSRWVEDDYKFYATDRSAKDLYTYQAFVERVIDGDTLKVRIDLGFDTWSRQVLRLRGIDCREMDTKEGQAAKAFVQSYIKEADRIIIRSSKSDKYDRYLADIFILPSANVEKDENIPRAKRVGITAEKREGEDEIYLNNLLLEKAHALRWEG